MMSSEPERAYEGTGFSSLLAASRAGDKEALEVLFRRFYPKVQRMVHTSLARDLRTARPWLAARFSTGDVVQDVCRSVLLDLSTFAGESEGAFAGFVAMVVRNRIVDTVRFHEAASRDGRRSKKSIDGFDGIGREDEPSDSMVAAEELERFTRALATFPEREQLLLRARFEGVLSYGDLAEQLGYTTASAARRAFYAAQARLAILVGTP